jgi:hypothetical protein
MRQHGEYYVIPDIILAGKVKLSLCKTGWHMGMELRYTRSNTQTPLQENERSSLSSVRFIPGGRAACPLQN